MFAINDTVMYGTAGVCKIVDIRKENFNAQDVLYYILQPVEDETSTIYYPVDSQKKKLRKLLSREQIDNLIARMPDTQAEWIDNDQLRREQSMAVLRKADHAELVQLIKTLYFHKVETQREGKKFHAADEKALQQAEELLYGEFAHVLCIQPDEVVPFITGTLNEQ